MTHSEYTQLAKDVRRIASKYKAVASEMEYDEIECVAQRAEEKAVELLAPVSVPGIRDLDRSLRNVALIYLVNTLDTSVEFDIEDPRMFCTDGYMELLMDGQLAPQILASNCVTAQDVVEWLDNYETEKRPRVVTMTGASVNTQPKA